MVAFVQRLIGAIRIDEGGKIDRRLVLVVAQESGRVVAVQETGAVRDQAQSDVVDVGWWLREAGD